MNYNRRLESDPMGVCRLASSKMQQLKQCPVGWSVRLNTIKSVVHNKGRRWEGEECRHKVHEVMPVALRIVLFPFFLSLSCFRGLFVLDCACSLARMDGDFVDRAAAAAAVQGKVIPPYAAHIHAILARISMPADIPASVTASTGASAATAAAPTPAPAATPAAAPTNNTNPTPTPTESKGTPNSSQPSSSSSSSKSSSSSQPRRIIGGGARPNPKGSHFPRPPPVHTSAQFFKFGLPFFAFMVLGSWGYAKVLQPGMDRADSNMKQQLYGRSMIDHDSQTGNKSFEAHQPKAPPKKMRTLEEEYERTKSQWEDNYQIIPVPKPPNAPKVR